MAPTEREKVEVSSPIRVLIAEDAPVVRRALVSLLETEPTIELVAAVEDAAQAVAKASDVHPDVALIDVRMPGGGGPRATRDILRASPGTRVVALSAHDEEEAVGAMLAAGALEYLLKGVPAEEIVEAIRRAAARPLLDLAAGPPTLELPA